MTTFENDTAYYMVKALVVVIGTLTMMSSCTKMKYPMKKTLVILGVYLLWVCVFTCAALRLLELNRLIQLCIPLISVPAMIVLYHISSFSPWQAVFNYTMQLSISVVLAMSQTIAVTLVHGGRLADLMIRLSSYALCIFAEYKFLRKRFLLLYYLPDKNWRSLTFVPIGFTGLLFLIATYPVHFTRSPVVTLYIYAVTAVMLMVYVILFHSLISQYDLQLAEYSNTILTAQSRSFQKQLEAINSTEEQIRIMRHNMRYHVIIVEGMITAGDAAGALEYLGSVGEKLEEGKKVTYCTNSTANAVLSYYIERAQSKGIETHVQFATPERADIDIIDFTAAVANALENAVNACSLVTDRPKRLRIRTTENSQYIIEIANSYTGNVTFDEEGLPVSKESGHGIGTRSIAAFARKNKALLDYDVTGEWFKLRIVLSGGEQ